MASDVRERMIAGAAKLLSRRGLQATSFAEVTQATQTPRGSIYHHFPGGKQELVLEALDRNSAEWHATIIAATHTSPEAFIADLTSILRSYLESTDFEAGSAIGAVTVAAENIEQLDRCKSAFETFVENVTDGLVASGAAKKPAREFASLFASSAAGSTLIARATRQLGEYDAATGMLKRLAAQLPRD